MAIPWLDFTQIREHANFAAILARYERAPRHHQGQVTILCPFHDDHIPSLSVNLDRKLFHCFACQAEGDVLDFVARMEQVSLPEAARLIAKICDLDLENKSRPHTLPSKATEDKSRVTATKRQINESRRSLETSSCCEVPLDPLHPYLFERGLTPALIREFGLGYCIHGRLKGRVCAPLHSLDGARILGHSGRWANKDVPEGVPRYLMPRGFRKNEHLFNYHRVRDARHIVVVEGYWSVFRLHALQIPAVALLGSSLSETQLFLLTQTSAKRITLLLDEDQAGRKATGTLLPRLSNLFFVRTPTLPDNESPDTISEQQLFKAVAL
jgi:DNA primase